MRLYHHSLSSKPVLSPASKVKSSSIWQLFYHPSSYIASSQAIMIFYIFCHELSNAEFDAKVVHQGRRNAANELQVNQHHNVTMLTFLFHMLYLIFIFDMLDLIFHHVLPEDAVMDSDQPTTLRGTSQSTRLVSLYIFRCILA
jgi:hypothetical protein